MTKTLMNRLLVSTVALCIGLLGMAGNAMADVPKETYDALGISKSASPKELFDALKKRYHDPAQGAGQREIW